MMSIATRTTVSPIGLAYDNAEFRAVQLVRTKSGEKLLASAVFPRMEVRGADQDPSVDELCWVGSILARRGFVGNSVATLPGSDWCSSHIFELPPVEDPSAKAQIARAEVAREKKCSPTIFELAYWDLPPRGRLKESMVVSCERARLDDALDHFESAGFVPKAVDLPELALARALHSGAVGEGIAGVLHVGWADSLAVITIGGRVVYTRRSKHGLGEIHERLGEEYSLCEDGAVRLLERMHSGTLNEQELPVQGMWSTLVRSLVEELDVAIRYVSHAYRMTELGSIAVCGYGATNESLLTEIDEVLGMPVGALVPSVLKDSGLGEDECGRLALALGLAERFDPS